MFAIWGLETNQNHSTARWEMIAAVITNMILYGKSNLNSVDIHANQINNYRLAMLVTVKQCFQNQGPDEILLDD